MSKSASFLFFVFAALYTAFYIALPMQSSGGLAHILLGDQRASVFFVESSSPEALRQNRALLDRNPYVRKTKILIVPGHDDEYWGTEYKGVKEAEMTLALGKKLGQLLSGDGTFDVIVTRDDHGYYPPLNTFFSEQAEDITFFAKAKKQIMSNLVALGEITRAEERQKVYHNKAASPVATRLYGINKWANENGVDMVVHIHFNDYPRRKKSATGEYSGFTIYVPERQYSNARAGREVAKAVSKRLKTFYSESNMPKESAGVVEDQDLIAIGAFNTLDSASILIEYGYIYEPQFLNPEIRAKTIENLAMVTYEGIRDFFGASASTVAGRFDTLFLPYTWMEPIPAGARNNPGVLALQAALTIEGVYPPEAADKRNCPLAGNYGKCTAVALALFQKKYGLDGEVGEMGEGTIRKLNELYGE